MLEITCRSWWSDWLTNFHRILALPGQGFHLMARVAVPLCLIVADVCGNRGRHYVFPPRIPNWDNFGRTTDLSLQFDSRLFFNWTQTSSVSKHMRESYILSRRTPRPYFWHHPEVSVLHHPVCISTDFRKQKRRIGTVNLILMSDMFIDHLTGALGPDQVPEWLALVCRKRRISHFHDTTQACPLCSFLDWESLSVTKTSNKSFNLPLKPLNLPM